MVVDDAFEEITRVVRGCDLLPSTPWQIDLQRALSLPSLSTDTCRCCWNRMAPNYRNPVGRFRSTSIAAPHALFSTLTYLSQAPPPELADSSIKEVWKWALGHWNPRALAGNTEVRLSALGDTKQNRIVKIVG